MHAELVSPKLRRLYARVALQEAARQEREARAALYPPSCRVAAAVKKPPRGGSRRGPDPQERHLP